MVQQKEACEKCTQTCLWLHGRRDPSPTVSSFFKPMIDKHFSKVLFIPPKFTGLVSHLIDQETYLEDSSGQQWKVGICEYKGSLAIKKGWHTFSNEHALKMGDFLVFHYIHGQHFVVQIFGTSGCQNLNFSGDTRSGKKRTRTDCKETTQNELLPETDRNLRKKGNSIPPVTVVQESEPISASNIDAETEKRQEVAQAQGAGDVQGVNGLLNDVSSNPRSSRKSSSIHEVPVATEFLTSKVLWDPLDVEVIQTHKHSEPVNNISPLGQKDKSDHPMDLLSCTSLKSAKNGGKGHTACSNQINRKKSNEASQFGEKARADERKLKMPEKAHLCDPNAVKQPTIKIEEGGCAVVKKTRADERKLKMPEKAHCTGMCDPNAGKQPTIKIEEGGCAVVNGYNKVIKSEPADFDDTSFPVDDPFSCLLQMDGRKFLELPQSWPQVAARRKNMGRNVNVILLQGADNRLWPVMYHERSGVKVLGGGWSSFAAASGLKPGDECVFQLLNPLARLFSVQKKPPALA